MRLKCVVLTLVLVVTPLYAQIYLGIGNIFTKCFSEPYEVAIFLMDDGQFFTMSTQEEEQINISPGYVKDTLEKYGYGVNRIDIFIHSHPRGFGRFSMRDERFIKRLKSYGFSGKSYIYHNPTKKIIPHKDN